MKKIFLLVTLCVISFFQTTEAAFHSENISINEALNQQIIQGLTTVVDVINFTDFSIDVANLSFPTFNRLTRKTAARIQDDMWANYVYLRLSDTYSGRIFFENPVPPLSLVSVYNSNGQYIVYVTPT